VSEVVTTERALQVVGIAGSLRRGSYNRALLAAARDLAPPGMTIVIETLEGVPLFNADLDVGHPPVEIVRLRDVIGKADALILATPEYNHGVPGVLKNAIDWLSQPHRGSVLCGLPTGIIGASTGLAGTARGQSQLRQSFVLTDTPVMLQPEVLVGRAQDKFDAKGVLIDEPSRRFLADFLARFEAWARQQPTARVAWPV
jgi:chromate reductase